MHSVIKRSIWVCAALVVCACDGSISTQESIGDESQQLSNGTGTGTGPSDPGTGTVNPCEESVNKDVETGAISKSEYQNELFKRCGIPLPPPPAPPESCEDASKRKFDSGYITADEYQKYLAECKDGGAGGNSGAPGN